MVKARSQFKERSSATNVEILLPLPPDAITPNVRTSQVSLPAKSSKGAQYAWCFSAAGVETLSFCFTACGKLCGLTSPSLACLQGAAVYAPEKEAMVWKIKNFPGGKEFLLRCKFGLPSVEAEEEAKGRMPPIWVKFEIPYFTVSGIQVSSRGRFLSMHVSGKVVKAPKRSVI